MSNPRKSGNPARRAQAAASPAQPVNMRPVRAWVAGARLRTLPLAVAPVAAGAGIAAAARAFNPWLTLLALLVAVLLQIGVNYANDYSDGVRGTDNFRVGPARLTGGGLVAPRLVKRAAFVCFGLAGIAGLTAVALSGRWWFLAVGVVAIVAAWFYTGGKHPYGYAGLGEVVVFIFFGLVAVVGTVMLQTHEQMQEPWLAGCGVGLLAVAVLLVNNLRDIPTDKQAGKRTLAVRIGARATRILFVVCVLLAFVVPAIYVPFYSGMQLVFLALIGAIPACIITLTGKTPRELILVLQITSLTALAYGVLLGIAFAF